MKQEVLEKLFSGQPLEGEELVFVAKSLKEDKDVISIPYNHEKEDYIDACGLTKKDVDGLNEAFTSFQKNLRETDKKPNVTRLTEEVERLALTNDKNLRALALGFIISNLVLQRREQDPLHGLLGKILGDLRKDSPEE
jgi:hypothetical protein